jgi:hypothetical protein
MDAFVDFSVIEGEGFRELTAGERVEFDYEPPVVYVLRGSWGSRPATQSVIQWPWNPRGPLRGSCFRATGSGRRGGETNPNTSPARSAASHES